MMYRMLGVVATFGLICYLLFSFLSSDSHVKKAVNANPEVQEQMQTLKSIGVDGTDPAALRKYTEQQAKQIEDYQNQKIPQE